MIVCNAIAPPVPPIIEAQGWAVQPDGRVMLVADLPTADPVAASSAAIATFTCQYR